jgi:hypothetical protein
LFTELLPEVEAWIVRGFNGSLEATDNQDEDET